MKATLDRARRTVRLAMGGMLALSALTVAAAVPPGEVVQAHELELPSGYTRSTVVTDLVNPVGMELGPDGRIYVLTGRATREISVLDEANGTMSTWLQVPQVLNIEMGLHGVTWHPDFENSPYVYLSYIAGATETSAQRYELTRYTVVDGTPDPASKSVLFTIDDWNPTVQLHQGGDLAFGADGKIYWAIGDRVNPPLAQDMSSFAGKMLRLDDDGTVPADNPFNDEVTGPLQAIYGLGLRNPWRVEANAADGEIYISSVGPADWEELDVVAPGANYGWPNVSGPSDDPAYTNGAWAYLHEVDGTPTGCAITGGAFMPAGIDNFPTRYDDKMFIGDHCFGWIDAVDVTTGTSERFMDGLESLIDVVIDPTTGSLYYLDRKYDHDDDNRSGGIGRVDYDPNATLAITEQPFSRTTSVGQTVLFSVEAVGQPPLSYQWFRDGEPLVDEVSAILTIESVGLADDGAEFTVTVTDGSGSLTSAPAILTVEDNTAPVPVIDAPTGATPWFAGETIAFSGSATDPEDGPLPVGSLSWDVVFHHNTHTHPFLNDIAGVGSGTFTIPTTGETAPDIWYRVYVTATDSDGLSATVFEDIFPTTVEVTIDTQPSGGSILLDSQPVTTPHTFTGVAGIERQIEAPEQQTIGGQVVDSPSWSTGETGDWTFVTPQDDTVIVATYETPSVAFACMVVGDTISWTDPGVDKVHVRHIVDGVNSYLVTLQGVSSWTVPFGFGTYELVARPDRVTTRTTCPADADGGPEAFACMVVGDTISWTDPGADKVHVRHIVDGVNSYLVTLEGVSSWTVPFGFGTYELVARPDRVTTRTTCPADVGGAPVAFECSVTDGMLSWSDQGDKRYFIRHLDGVDNVYLGEGDDSLTFEVPFTTGSYRVIARAGGVSTTANCQA